MTSYKQDLAFAHDVVGTGLLETSIDWIQSNMNPEEVFTEKQLSAWAEVNGFTKVDA